MKLLEVVKFLHRDIIVRLIRNGEGVFRASADEILMHSNLFADAEVTLIAPIDKEHIEISFR